MKIYTDKAEQTAVIVCNADELCKIEHAMYTRAKDWLDKAKEQGETWLMDVNLKIAAQYMDIDKQLSDKLDESEAGNPKIK